LLSFRFIFLFFALLWFGLVCLALDYVPMVFDLIHFIWIYESEGSGYEGGASSRV
jgi:hypothetical protein